MLLQLANALTIEKPIDTDTLYSSLVRFNVNWNADTDICKYALNNLTNTTFDCQEDFIIDMPFNKGSATVTLYGILADTTVTTDGVFINVDDYDTSVKAYTTLGIIIFNIFMPLFLLALSFFFKLLEVEENQHIAIRYFFVLLSMAFIFIGYGNINLAARQYIHTDDVITANSPFIYGWVFIITIFYIFIFIIYKAFELIARKKADKVGKYD